MNTNSINFNLEDKPFRIFSASLSLTKDKLLEFSVIIIDSISKNIQCGKIYDNDFLTVLESQLLHFNPNDSFMNYFIFIELIYENQVDKINDILKNTNYTDSYVVIKEEVRNSIYNNSNNNSENFMKFKTNYLKLLVKKKIEVEILQTLLI